MTPCKREQFQHHSFINDIFEGWRRDPLKELPGMLVFVLVRKPRQPCVISLRHSAVRRGEQAEVGRHPRGRHHDDELAAGGAVSESLLYRTVRRVGDECRHFHIIPAKKQITAGLFVEVKGEALRGAEADGAEGKAWFDGARCGEALAGWREGVQIAGPCSSEIDFQDKVFHTLITPGLSYY